MNSHGRLALVPPQTPRREDLAVPTRDRRQTRYPITLVSRTLRMYDEGRGLTPTEILRELAKEPGPTPSLHTIRIWVVPGQADYQREKNKLTARRRRSNGGQPMWSSGRLAGEALQARMVELKSAGLSCRMIAIVLERYHGALLSTVQVEHRLRTPPPSARLCAAEGCGSLIVYSGRGRYPKWCSKECGAAGREAPGTFSEGDRVAA